MPSDLFGSDRNGFKNSDRIGFGLDHFGSDRIRILKVANNRIGNFQSDPMHTFNTSCFTKTLLSSKKTRIYIKNALLPYNQVKETLLSQKFKRNCNLVANESLNSVNESQVISIEKSLSRKINKVKNISIHRRKIGS